MCANISGPPAFNIIRLSWCEGGSFLTIIAPEGYYEITVSFNP
jgi:hypothetical protein